MALPHQVGADPRCFSSRQRSKSRQAAAAPGGGGSALQLGGFGWTVFLVEGEQPSTQASGLFRCPRFRLTARRWNHGGPGWRNRRAPWWLTSPPSDVCATGGGGGGAVAAAAGGVWPGLFAARGVDKRLDASGVAPARLTGGGLPPAGYFTASLWKISDSVSGRVMAPSTLDSSDGALRS